MREGKNERIKTMSNEAKKQIESVMAPDFGRALKAISSKQIPPAIRTTKPAEVEGQFVSLSTCCAKAISAS